MKKILNVLYVLTQESYLSKQGETVCVKVGGEEKVRIPAHTIESIACFGNTTVSTPLIGFCADKGIGLSFFSENGKFYGRISGPMSGNVLLRHAQFRAYGDMPRQICLVRGFLLTKIANCRHVLMRAARESEGPDQRKLHLASTSLAEIARELPLHQTVDGMRGLEGLAAMRYFGAFDHMIKANKEDFFFRERSKRPPLDNMNAILSFLYTLLANDVRSALEGVGLDPATGFLHTLRPGRPSLALDIMEELRAPLCDRLALALVNLRQLTAKDFEQNGPGVNMTESARRELISAWQKRKREEVIHPYLKEKMQIGLVPHIQALLLARHLRGDLSDYPPFLWR
ncbi:MAG: CRISPR-associated exonuclease Cas4/endonuclease Cas1 fusion [Firmicutes bacterium]|nr:CRISPR-associated exonuclease Cas4/endonuclease Cas1 fusion [candidate division NPL-UPA2 bacterium]MBT9155528.1 CRISPR-associated exonuclease Cas4/endonuclease Cas1 fusion [candidate division NPL-UPA2 bacterium]